MTDDRSERLRKRRKQSTDSRDQHDEGTPSKPSKQDKPTERKASENGHEDTKGEAESVSIKEEQVGTYMYLPETQTRELRRLYNVLKAEYEFKYDEEFEKNRHFYPLVVEYGLEHLDGLDASEIRDHLKEIV